MDRGFDRFVRNVQDAQRGHLRVGILPKDAARTYRTGVTVGEVAAWHEQGTATMPARPFLTSWFERRGLRYLSEVTDVIRHNMQRGGARQALRSLGQRAVSEVRAGLRSLAPLARSTVERKGNARVLRATGLLARTISTDVDVRRGRVSAAGTVTRGAGLRGLGGRR
jgi:hypothetical protein